MPKYRVLMHDYVRIDAEVEVEAFGPDHAALLAKMLWSEGDDEVSTENSWESWDEGTQIDSVEELA